MPSPKNGKAGTVVSPADPVIAEAADVADPGAVDSIKAKQRETSSGKYGSEQLKPFKAGSAGDGAGKERKTAWIEIELVDEDGQPVPGAVYRVRLPDDTVAEGTLDEGGKARVEGFEPGTCQVSFPGLDRDAWEPV